MTIRTFSPLAAVSLMLVACGGAAPNEDAGSSDTAAMPSDSGAAPQVADLPEWLPADFPLPDDFELDGANHFGGSKHLLDGRTDMPLDQAYDFFSDRLVETGYDVRTNEDGRSQNIVHFEGQGCEDCTVTIADAGAWRTLRIGLTLPKE